MLQTQIVFAQQEEALQTISEQTKLALIAFVDGKKKSNQWKCSRINDATEETLENYETESHLYSVLRTLRGSNMTWAKFDPENLYFKAYKGIGSGDPLPVLTPGKIATGSYEEFKFKVNASIDEIIEIDWLANSSVYKSILSGTFPDQQYKVEIIQNTFVGRKVCTFIE